MPEERLWCQACGIVAHEQAQEIERLQIALRDLLSTTPEERQNPTIWFKRVDAARALISDEAASSVNR
jgi:hypothetical protein